MTRRSRNTSDAWGTQSWSYIERVSSFTLRHPKTLRALLAADDCGFALNALRCSCLGCSACFYFYPVGVRPEALVMATAVELIIPGRKRSWRIWARAACPSCAAQSDPALEDLLLQWITPIPPREWCSEPASLPTSATNQPIEPVNQGEPDD
jgi:hypothetical protein